MKDFIDKAMVSLFLVIFSGQKALSLPFHTAITNFLHKADTDFLSFL